MTTKYILAVGLLLAFLQICYGQSETDPQDGTGAPGKGKMPPPTCPVQDICGQYLVIVQTNGFTNLIFVNQICERRESCKIDKLMIKQIEEEEQRDCPEKPDVAVPVVPTGNEAAIEEEEVKGGKGKLVRCVTRGGVECMVRAPKGKGCKGPKKPTPVVPTTSAPGAAAPGADVPSADSPVPVPVPSAGQGIVAGDGNEDGGNTDVAFADGGWSAWNPWVSGNCPVTCCMGNPLQSRIRRCNNPAPAGGGADCQGLHYALRDAPDTERCGSMDNQCPIICQSATSKYADTCRRCVNNYYQCDAEGAAPRRANCPVGQVWSQHMTGCVTPSFCNAVERF